MPHAKLDIQLPAFLHCRAMSGGLAVQATHDSPADHTCSLYILHSIIDIMDIMQYRQRSIIIIHRDKLGPRAIKEGTRSRSKG